jgi:hypothetical protein
MSDLSSAYPPRQYIAMRGTGGTQEEAEAAALAALGRYFSSEVTSRTAASESLVSADGGVAARRAVRSDVFVNSETKLFSVRYAEAWKNPATGAVETAAYIDRDEAWAVYRPRVEASVAPFRAAVRSAESTSDPIRQYYLYRNASRAVPEDFTETIAFAYALNPAKAAEYDALRDAAGEAAQRAENARDKIALYITCKNDSNGAARAAIEKAFSGHGFKITPDESLSTNWIEADIEPNEEKLEAGTFYTPRLSLTLYGSGGAIFTWNGAVPERHGAKNPDIARRRAWAALADVVGGELWEKFEENMDGI